MMEQLSYLDFVDVMLLGRSGDHNMASSKSTKTKYVVTSDQDGKQPCKIFSEGRQNDSPVGTIVDVSTPSGQDAALGLVGSVEWIVITCQKDREDGWIMIPAENLISSCQGTDTKIAAFVDRAGDIGGLARALELGVDALCVNAGDVIENGELWDALVSAKEERLQSAAAAMKANYARGGTSGPTIVQGRCHRVDLIGGKSTVLADRVCIDLVQSLKPTEGCWIGSSAKIMDLVLSEAAQSSFVPSRPFRVNAGLVHSYVVVGDGSSTKYLSELVAGDEVLVYDVVSGNERPVGVGRLKVERRPCVQVGLYTDEGGGSGSHRGQLFLQQAETVRLGQTLGDDSFL